MSQSNKKDRSNPAKTKAELKKDLAKTKKELQQAQADWDGLQEQMGLLEMRLAEAQEKLKDRSEQSDQLQQDVDELKRIQKNLQNENKKLKQKVQELTQSSIDPSEIETLHDKLKVAKQKQQEAEQAKMTAETKVSELEYTILELESKVVEHEKNNLDGTKEIPASKATFRIYVFPGEGDYQGTIEHLPTNAKMNFKKLSQKLLFEFISKHLPQQLMEEEAMRTPSKTPKTPAIEQSPHVQTEEKMAQQPVMQKPIAETAKILEEIKFEQFKRIVEKGATLRARKLFNIFVQLHFPIVPNDQNIDIDTSAYIVQLIIKDFEKKKIIDRLNVTDLLSPGKTKYENIFSLPGMEPGKYLLTIYAFAPFANVEESKQLEVAVQ